MSGTASGLREACRHCGLPLRTALDDESAFCCTGCRVAWRIGADSEEGAVQKMVARLVLAAFLSMGVMVFSLSLYGEAWGRAAGAPGGDFDGEAAAALRGLLRLAALALSTPVLLLLGKPLLEAIVGMRRWLSVESFVLTGVTAAYSVSVWNTFRGGGEVYFETASMVLVLLSLGRWLEAEAKRRAAARLGHLLSERVEEARRIGDDGAEMRVDPAEVAPGERVRVLPGELVPVDGRVVAGRAFVDTAALTGESVPRAVGPGDLVFAATVPTDGALEVEASTAGALGVAARIEGLLGRALRSRARLVRVADRFAGVLLVGVLVLAAATAWFHRSAGVEPALLNALSVLLIACPCALGIAAPLAFWVALGAAWRGGMLVRGADVLEALAGARRIVFDKTGTLTDGRFRLARLVTEPGVERAEALAAAAALEAWSEHPLGRALVEAWRDEVAVDGGDDEVAPARIDRFRALAGIGVEGVLAADVSGPFAGRLLRLARPRNDGEDGGQSERTPGESSGEGRGEEPEATRVELSADGRRIASFELVSRLRPEAGNVLGELRANGLGVLVLTGDEAGPARAAAEALGVEVRHGLLPEDKLREVRELGPGTVYVGDGLNDTAALVAADVGIAVQGGVPRTLETADAGLLRPGLGQLPGLIALARRATRVARGNLVWAFAYNAVGLWLAASGRLTPVFAASAMVASSLVVVLRSRLRVERPGDGEGVRPAPYSDRSDPAVGADPGATASLTASADSGEVAG